MHGQTTAACRRQLPAAIYTIRGHREPSAYKARPHTLPHTQTITIWYFAAKAGCADLHAFLRTPIIQTISRSRRQETVWIVQDVVNACNNHKRWGRLFCLLTTDQGHSHLSIPCKGKFILEGNVFAIPDNKPKSKFILCLHTRGKFIPCLRIKQRQIFFAHAKEKYILCPRQVNVCSLTTNHRQVYYLPTR